MITDCTASADNTLNQIRHCEEEEGDPATTTPTRPPMTKLPLGMQHNNNATLAAGYPADDPVDPRVALLRQKTNTLLSGRIPDASTPRAAPIIVSVEAAIGTGKSTLLRLLAEAEPSWVFVQEPVDIWQAVDGRYNLLEAFYNDPARYAFSFQTYCVLSRIEAVEAALVRCPVNTPVMLVERSWFSDRHTFAQMLIDSGKINPMEAALYNSWFEFACKNGPKINGHLYLEADAETCMVRLRRRGRSEETAVTKDYQRDLINHHEKWLEGLDADRVCRVNVDEDFLSSPDARTTLMNHIRSYVDGLRYI